MRRKNEVCNICAVMQKKSQRWMRAINSIGQRSIRSSVVSQGPQRAGSSTKSARGDDEYPRGRMGAVDTNVFRCRTMVEVKSHDAVPFTQLPRARLCHVEEIQNFIRCGR